MKTGAEIIGLNELKGMFRNLEKLPDKRKAASIFYNRAKELRDAMRSKAPQGPTGNLKRGIVAKRFKKGAGAFVAIDYRIAPHAHLVERGTRGPRNPKHAQWMKFIVNGQTVYAKQVGPMPAQPFFWPTYDRRKRAVGKKLSQDLKRLIEQTAKK